MRYGILIILFISSCSDYTKELSGGYFFRGEGGTTNDILCHRDQREIPSNVLRYNYDKDFIIAEQKPNAEDDPLYSKVDYRLGRDKIYYWLIVHSDKQVIGPMTKDQYDSALTKYKVNLELNDR